MAMKVVAVVVGSLLPLAALAVYFVVAGDVRVLQEGGQWSYAVIATTLLLGLAPPALAGFTGAPRALWAAMALVPLGVGVAGSLLGGSLVASAIAAVSPADKLVMAAVGTGEIAATLSLALMVGGACVAGLAVVVVVVDRGPGGPVLLAVAGAAAVLGLRWLLVREVLIASGDVDPAQRVMVLASIVPVAQVLGFAVVGAFVVLLTGGLATLLRAGPWASSSSSLGLGAAAAVLVALTVGGHLSLSALPAQVSPPLPSSELARFAGDDGVVPGMWIKVGGTAPLDGAVDAVAIDAAVGGAELRRGLVMRTRADDVDASVLTRLRLTDTQPELIFVGPPGPDTMIDGLALPEVLEPLLRHRTSGVSTTPWRDGACRLGDAWPCGAEELRLQIVVLGRARLATSFTAQGARYVQRATDGDLDLLPGPVALAFDDDVDARTFAAVLSRLAQHQRASTALDQRRAHPLFLITAAPPPLHELRR